MREDYILNRVTELRKERNWSMYRLAKEAEVSYSTLSNTFRRNYVPTMSTLLQICNGFGITLAEFFDEGHTLAEQLTPPEQELLADWNHLSKQEKRLVTAYIHGLLKIPAEVFPEQAAESQNDTKCPKAPYAI